MIARRVAVGLPVEDGSNGGRGPESHAASASRAWTCSKRSKVASGVSPATASNCSRASSGQLLQRRRSFTVICSRMVSRWASSFASSISSNSCSKLIDGLTTTGLMSVRF